MDDDDDTGRPLLAGIVEVDETFIGGREEGVGRGQSTNKVVVAGAKSRDGQIRLEIVKDRTRGTLHGFIRRNVSPDAEAIHTDDWVSYRGLTSARHETVNHSEKEWVVGNVHTNGVEGVWSLLKRSIIGAFHKVSVKHLDRYLDELEWRFNGRNNPFLFRDTLIRLADGRPLRWTALVA
jgi:transposase-like protein